VEAVGEMHSILYQSVNVGGMDLRVVNGMNRAEHKIVRDEEQEVRPGDGSGGYGLARLAGGKCSGGQFYKFSSVHALTIVFCNG
jgi:hypothetical protein